MNQEDYIKQLEASNQLLQQKLEETTVKLEESFDRQENLMNRPDRIWTLNGYKDIKSAKDYAAYKNKPYPENSVYPDYMYWTLDTHNDNRQEDANFCNHFIQQMRRYVGLPNTDTNCRELWLDDKMMDMSVLVLHWYRTASLSATFADITHRRYNVIKRSYIIERGNPQVYYHRGRGRYPHIVPAIRMK